MPMTTTPTTFIAHLRRWGGVRPALCYALRWCQMPKEPGSRLALHREYCTHRQNR